MASITSSRRYDCAISATAAGSASSSTAASGQASGNTIVSASDTPDAPYRVSVGAYANRDNAQRQAEAFAGAGYPVFIGAQGNLNIVLVGPYDSESEARTVADRIRSSDMGVSDPTVYAEWYGHEHRATELQKEAVYGLTEFYRDEIRDARLVAGTGYSGQISFDWIVGGDGCARAIECNPRATSGLHLFARDAALPAALMGDEVDCPPPPGQPDRAALRLSLCAAGAAADGADITRLCVRTADGVGPRYSSSYSPARQA